MLLHSRCGSVSDILKGEVVEKEKLDPQATYVGCSQRRKVFGLQSVGNRLWIFGALD